MTWQREQTDRPKIRHAMRDESDARLAWPLGLLHPGKP